MLSPFGIIQLAGLALFLSIFLGRTLYLRIRRRVSAITLDLRHKGWRGLVEVALFVLVNVWATEVVFYSIPSGFRLFPAPLDMWVLNGPATRVGGAVLIVIGLAIFAQAMRDLGPSWRLGIDEKTPGQLVTDGIYAYSRHPIYLFFNLYFMGTFLVNGTLIFLLFALLIAGNLHLQILNEEAFLLRTYGRAYQEYRLRTARYLGRRRPRPVATAPGEIDPP